MEQKAEGQKPNMKTKSAYGRKLLDPRWQKARLRVMDRDGFVCRDCGAKDKTLNVHHCFYERGDPWDTEDQFLLTLCEDCHKSRGDLEAEGKRSLGKIYAGLSNSTGRNDLDVLVKSLLLHAGLESTSLVVVDAAKNHEETLLRWHDYAFRNADGRKMFEAVTGDKVGWPS